jgi:hypothetical protein
MCMYLCLGSQASRRTGSCEAHVCTWCSLSGQPPAHCLAGQALARWDASLALMLFLCRPRLWAAASRRAVLQPLLPERVLDTHNLTYLLPVLSCPCSTTGHACRAAARRRAALQVLLLDWCRTQAQTPVLDKPATRFCLYSPARQATPVGRHRLVVLRCNRYCWSDDEGTFVMVPGVPRQLDAQLRCAAALLEDGSGPLAGRFRGGHVHDPAAQLAWCGWWPLHGRRLEDGRHVRWGVVGSCNHASACPGSCP